MGGKSGGRKAADQVILTAQQLFERYAPSQRRPGRGAQADRARSAPDDQADRDHVRGRAAQHDRRVPDQPDARMRLRPRRRLAHLPLPRRRDGEPHHRPFLRAAAGRRGPDHRGRSQHPSAVEPADRLPGHLPGPAADRSSTSTSSRSATACWPAATACGTTSRPTRAGRHRARAAAARGQRDAGRQGAPARARRAATTCRSRWSGSSRWPEPPRAQRRRAPALGAAAPMALGRRLLRLCASARARAACAARALALRCAAALRARARSRRVAPRSRARFAAAASAASAGARAGVRPGATPRRAAPARRARLAQPRRRRAGAAARAAARACSLRARCARRLRARRARCGRSRARRAPALRARRRSSASRRSRLASSMHDGDDEALAALRARARRSAPRPRRARSARSGARSRRPSRRRGRRRPHARRAPRRHAARRARIAERDRTMLHVSDVSTVARAPAPGTRPTASRAAATPCAGTRAPAALRCTAPRAATAADMMSLTRRSYSTSTSQVKRRASDGQARRHLRHVGQQHGVELGRELEVVVLRARPAAQRAGSRTRPRRRRGAGARISRCSMCSTGSLVAAPRPGARRRSFIAASACGAERRVVELDLLAACAAGSRCRCRR